MTSRPAASRDFSKAKRERNSIRVTERVRRQVTFFTAIVATVFFTMTFSEVALSSTTEEVHGENIELEKALSAVPAPLRPWVKAEFSSLKRNHCVPRAGNSQASICNWPTRLELRIDLHAGRFQFFVVLHEAALVRLPGSPSRWPLDVKSNGEPALVVEKNGSPYTHLSKGAYVLVGKFLWDQPPELMQLPQKVGQVRLKMRGKEMPFPVIDDDGKLWLQKRVEEAKEKNALSLWVHRKISDGAVGLVEVRLELQVSGESREITLGPVFDDGWVPKSLQSDLPARIDDDGKLTVQVRPGTHQVTLVARKTQRLENLRFNRPDDELWPESEVWVFQAAPSIRQVRIEGSVGIDPAQTRLPSSWKSLPAYLMKPDAELRLIPERRGDEFPTPDRLELARTMWLDFDGKGITFDDEIRGTIHRSRRLEMNAPTTLGQVTLGGSFGDDQFITGLDDVNKGKVGVEVRGQHLQVRATSRYEGSLLDVPAVSWSHDFHKVQDQLHLPPGYRLLHVSGVDDVSDTWLKRWTLMEFFLLLITTLVAVKLFGFPWGVVTFFTLLLVIPEESAPRWIFLFLLAVEALNRVLSEGIPSYVVRGIRAFGLFIFVLITLPFAVQQVRVGMYPSLKKPWNNMSNFKNARSVSQFSSIRSSGYRQSLSDERPSGAASAMDDLENLLELEKSESKSEPPAPPKRMKNFKKKGRLNKLALKNIANIIPQQQTAELAHFDPGAQVQTGPGLPSWTWDKVQITFSGPVKSEQKIALYVVTPLQNLFLGFLRAGLLLLLTLCFLRLPGNFWPRFLKSKIPQGGPLIGLAFALFAANTSHAQVFPPQDLVDKAVLKVKERLPKPLCTSDCVGVGQLRLVVKEQRAKLELDVDVLEERAFLLPGRRDQWQLEKVLVDGKESKRLSREGSGLLFVALKKGRHRVTMVANLANAQNINIPLPSEMKVHHVRVSLDGWTTESVHEDGKADSVLTLQRIQKEKGSRLEQDRFESRSLPAFARVTRSFNLGLTWSVETFVQRESPLGEPIAIDLPLLDGEKVISDGARVEGSRVKIHLGPRQSSFRFSSNLAERPKLILRAPKADASYHEDWAVEVSNLWHLEEQGIPPLLLEEHERTRSKRYAPWPEETLTLQLSRPKGIGGQALTIDKSRLVLQPGIRATDATLSFTLRASRGDSHGLRVPKGAEVSKLTIDGKNHPIRVKDGMLSFSTKPGEQNVVVTWREPKGVESVFHTPVLDLRARGVNAEVVVKVPNDRWVLFVWGPPLGPAVLFWSLLFGLLVVAFGLSRLTQSPLKTQHWLLLGFGLSQVHLVISAMVVGWILLVSWRERKVEVSPWLFAFRQLLVVTSTMVAMLCLFGTIHTGLLGDPDMQITGNGSNRHTLNWMLDRLEGPMPDVTMLSVPLVVYRIFMLLWALWLAAAVVRWLKWTWKAFGEGGFWRDFPSAPSSKTPKKSSPQAEQKLSSTGAKERSRTSTGSPIEKKEGEMPSSSATSGQALPKEVDALGTDDVPRDKKDDI